MPIVLLRVDERLIHGQVVVGWGEHIHMDRIAVVDDEISASPWEQELYCLGVPPPSTPTSPPSPRRRRTSRAGRANRAG
jgi:PTS system mannose-specific IIB component/fructoselysine and glucoselysine-specific PTS system IIB component